MIKIILIAHHDCIKNSNFFLIIIPNFFINHSKKMFIIPLFLCYSWPGPNSRASWLTWSRNAWNRVTKPWRTPKWANPTSVTSSWSEAWAECPRSKNLPGDLRSNPQQSRQPRRSRGHGGRHPRGRPRRWRHGRLTPRRHTVVPRVVLAHFDIREMSRKVLQPRWTFVICDWD